MQRRHFLLGLPAGLLGGLVSGHRPTAPERLGGLDGVLRAELWDRTDDHLRQLHEISRRWYRHGDAQVESRGLLAALAEIWCRERGLTALHADGWLALATQWPDASTGVPFLEAAAAVEGLDEHANTLVPWHSTRMLRSGDIDYLRIPVSRRDVARVLDLACRCDEAVRRQG